MSPADMIAYFNTYRDQVRVELICHAHAVREAGFITSRGDLAAKTRLDSARQFRDREFNRGDQGSA